MFYRTFRKRNNRQTTRENYSPKTYRFTIPHYISLIQKGSNLKVDKGLLDNDTRRLLVQNVLERLQRYEKYRGVEIKMEEIIRQQSKEIAAWIEENIKYKPYTAKW